MNWWNASYPYRRDLTLLSSESISVGHPVHTILNHEYTIEQGKLREDYADLEVLFWDGAATPSWHLIGRDVTPLGDSVLVKFDLQEPMEPGIEETRYYIYYGNRNLVGVETRPDYEVDDWPIEVMHDDAEIDYTRPGEHWKNGYADEYGAKATLEFSGGRLRIIATPGYYEGIAEVQLDNGPWEDVNLFSNHDDPDSVVYVKTDLTAGLHKLRYRVSGRKDPRSQGYRINLERIDLARDVDVIDVGEEIVALGWATVMGGSVE